MKTFFKKYLWVFVVALSAFVLLYFLFIFDIGLNSKYFVKRDFEKAFTYRVSGNCDLFGQYIGSFAKEWFERCLDEKEQADKYPIKQFSFKSVSKNSDQAFLQVELTRDLGALSIREEIKDDSFKYVVNYEMKKTTVKLLGIFPMTTYLINQYPN